MRSPFYPQNAAARTLFCVLLFFPGCAYFNTFYNARQYFNSAEKTRLQQQGQSLPKGALDAYELAIEKSAKILVQFPDSRFRLPALMLMAKSHFHLMQYKRAQLIFLQLKNESSESDLDEIHYWLSLCKWRQGRSQAALEELVILNEQSNDQKLKARISFSIADIHLETGKNNLALEFLKQGAELTRNSNERAEIYHRIAILALYAGDYERALEANRNVIRNSLTKVRIEEANLNIVKIYRELEDWETVSALIRKLLASEDYRAIWGQLELELAKLYRVQGETDQALSRLEAIGSDYSRTETSAEAYYIMGEMALALDRNFDVALKHYLQVPRELGSSSFKAPAKKREKEITAFKSARERVAEIRSQFEPAEVSPDSSLADSAENAVEIDVNKLRKNLSAELYKLGELWAFHFDDPDSALVFFREITDSLPETDLNVKSLFSISYLLEQKGSSAEADSFRSKILEEYPKSEYADHIRNFLNLKEKISSSHALLLSGEDRINYDLKGSFNLYRQILNQDTTSEYSAMAAFSLAHHFDTELHEPDSALKYYSWLAAHHPESEQFLTARPRLVALERFIASLAPDTSNQE